MMDKESILTSIAMRLKAQFTQIETDRYMKEQEWISALRQFRGEYPPDVLARIRANGSNEVYPKFTRAKVLTALAKIHEIVFPDTDRNWSIMPSPVATVPRQTLEQIMRQIVQQDEQGNPIQPTNEQVQSAINSYSAQACAMMEQEISDQLDEIGYQLVAKDVILSGLIFGTGILKGPLAMPVTNYKWQAQDSGYATVAEKIYKPYIEFVPVWDFYPDMSSQALKQCEGIFQRHVFTKHDLRELAKRPDFDGVAIIEYIRTFQNGDCVYKSWETDLQTMSDETIKRDRKYEVLEYWGYIDGNDLMSCGMDIAPERLEDEYECNIWTLGNRVIKIVMNPYEAQLRPFHVFYFEKDETSIFGTGIPKVMKDTDTAIAAASRMLLDNAAIVCGPNVEVNYEMLMQNGQDVQEIHPFKIWMREGRGGDAQYPAIRSIEFNSHISELMSIINQFKQISDEETTIPTYMLAEPQRTTNETARGLSMRMASLNMTIKDVVRKFDDANSSFIKGMYEWNMQFNPKQEIKGDYDVVARGSTSLVSKEIMMQALDFFAQTISPAEEPHLDRRRFLAERLKAHNLNPNDLMKSEEEAQAMMQGDPQQQQMMMEKMQADTDYQKSKALHMMAKSKKAVEEIKQIPQRTAAETSVQKASALKNLAGAKKNYEEANTQGQVA